MELTQKDIDQLEAYHRSELAADAETALRTRLVDDADFRLAVQEWESFWISGVKPTSAERAEREDRKQALKELENKLPPVKPEDGQRNWWLYGVLLLVGAVGIWWFVDSQTKTPAEPAEEQMPRPQFQAFDTELFEHLTRDGANLGSDQDEALTAYDSREYARAWPLLLEQVQRTNVDSILLLYTGVAALASQEPAQAVSALEPLLRNASFRFYQEEVQWYLALAYLEQGEAEKGQTLLRELVASGSVYAPEAEVLLEE